jgi:general L-amino acid transport system permease protein
MTVYVEIFRNVPLVLWIILIFVVFTETYPQPKDFRVTDEMVAAGEAPKETMIFGAIAITNRGSNIPGPVFDRPLPTIEIATVPISLSGVAFLVVVLGSVLVNRRILARAKAIQEDTGDRPTTWWQSLLVLFVPAIALLMAMGFHLEYPEIKGFNFTGGLAVNHSFTALLVALILYTGAFIAEIVRGGIQAISKGQTEAAFALGLRPGRTMNLVILPQALRVIIPPLISQFLNLTKNTSLGIAVSYLDLRGTLGGITMNQTGREMECMVLMMGIYLTISLLISSLMNIYNNSVKLKER